MVIHSDSKSSGFFKFISGVSSIFFIFSSTYILGMSYGYMPSNPMHTLILLVISLVLTNIVYANADKEWAQAMEDQAVEKMLKDSPLLAPISLILSIAMLVTLVIGSMTGWYWYLIGTIVSVIISKAHKSRLGVIEKQ